MRRHRQLFGLAAVSAMLLLLPGAPSTASRTDSTPARPRAAQEDKSRGEVTAQRQAEPLAATGPQRFYAITPYRAYDSRNDISGPIFAGEAGAIDVATDEGADPMIPYTANAVTYNLTVTSTASIGFLALYPSDSYWPGNSSINWTGPQQTLANGGVVALTPGLGEIEVYAGGPAGSYTHFIIDITGYYAP